MVGVSVMVRVRVRVKDSISFGGMTRIRLNFRLRFGFRVVFRVRIKGQRLRVLTNPSPFTLHLSPFIINS